MVKIKVHPLAVKFEEIECCALKTAIADASNSQFIKESIEKARQTEPEYSWSFLTEMFERTGLFIFVPHQIHRAFYFNLAVMEKKRLEQEGKALSCDHTLVEHIKALNNICFMVACPKGEN